MNRQLIGLQFVIHVHNRNRVLGLPEFSNLRYNLVWIHNLSNTTRTHQRYGGKLLAVYKFKSKNRPMSQGF